MYNNIKSFQKYPAIIKINLILIEFQYDILLIGEIGVMWDRCQLSLQKTSFFQSGLFE